MNWIKTVIAFGIIGFCACVEPYSIAAQEQPNDPFGTTEEQQPNDPFGSGEEAPNDPFGATEESKPPKKNNPRPVVVPDKASNTKEPNPIETSPTAPVPAIRTPAPRPLALELTTASSPRVLQADALIGKPFGVGRITYRVSPGDEMTQRTRALRIGDPGKRILFPVNSQTAFNRFVETITRNDANRPRDTRTIWFLFRGETPLDLTLDSTGSTKFTIPIEFPKQRRRNRIAAREKKFDRLYRQWWREYKKVAKDQGELGDYPPLIETYMTAMILSLIHI